MAEVQRKKEHPKNVKGGNERILKAEHHHGIYVVVAKRVFRQSQEPRIGRAESKVEQVINDEDEQDEPAHHHGAGGECCLYDVFAPVTLRPGAPVLDREPDRVVNMRQDDNEQKGPNNPENRSEVVQMLGVTIDPIRPEEDLEIAEEMSDNEEDQDHSRHRHNDLPSDG